MPDSANVAPMRSGHIYVISPKKFYDEAQDADFNTRENLLAQMHGIIEAEGEFVFSKGKIQITRLFMDYGEDPSYWGGDGIIVTIPHCYDGAQLRESLIYNLSTFAEKFIVFDPMTGNYYGADRPHKPNLSLVAPNQKPK